MSLASMTGYGHGECRWGDVRVEAEISSVNRKQFDLQLHMQRPLQVLESRIQDEVGRAVARGRITLSLSVALAPGGRRRVRVDEALARGYVEAVRKAAPRLELPDRLDSRALAEMPDVLIVEHPEDDADRLWPAIRRALRQALSALVRMRRREGRALERDLRRRMDELERRVGRIERHAPAAVRRHRAALVARLKEAGVAPDADDRIAREIALFADRSDVAEEITRLRSHLAQARRLLAAREPAGRSLDFLAQELFREINTVGSKSGDASITAEVVAFKAELERVREQVQNVE